MLYFGCSCYFVITFHLSLLSKCHLVCFCVCTDPQLELSGNLTAALGYVTHSRGSIGYHCNVSSQERGPFGELGLNVPLCLVFK